MRANLSYINLGVTDKKLPNKPLVRYLGQEKMRTSVHYKDLELLMNNHLMKCLLETWKKS